MKERAERLFPNNILVHEFSMLFVRACVMRSLCPRCGSETLTIGKSTIEAANKKQIHVILWQCPKCGLLFSEAA